MKIANFYVFFSFFIFKGHNSANILFMTLKFSKKMYLTSWIFFYFCVVISSRLKSYLKKIKCFQFFMFFFIFKRAITQKISIPRCKFAFWTSFFLYIYQNYWEVRKQLEKKLIFGGHLGFLARKTRATSSFLRCFQFSTLENPLSSLSPPVYGFMSNSRKYSHTEMALVKSETFYCLLSNFL